MKIRVYSDLHNEFSRFEPPAIDADVVVLAGDIDLGTRGIEWAGEAFAGSEIIYVAGNHEYYRQSYLDLQRRLGDASGTVHFLDRAEVVIGGVRFLGATLWTDFSLFGAENFSECLEVAGERLNDFRLIRHDGSRLLRPMDTLRMHDEAVAWIEHRLRDEPFSGPTVVVTHHAPCAKSLPVRFSSDRLSAAYASNLERLMGYSRLWIHGHTHDSCDYSIGKTRVICNPRGYTPQGKAGENPRFDPAFLVEI